MAVFTKKRPAFTLIELLAILAILAILAAMVLPTLKSARLVAYRQLFLASLGHPQATRVAAPSWLQENTTWEQAYQTIRTNLTQAGFASFGLYLIPADQGFFVITAPERIQTNGLPAVDRWDLARKLLPHGTLKEWLHAFFTMAPEGVYRINVLAVTTELPIDTTNQADWVYLSTLADAAGDYSHLPASLREEKVGEARLHNYIYLYERAQSETTPHPLNDRSLSAEQHLQNDGLLNLSN